MAKLMDLTSKRFGRWLVLARAENRGTRVCWLCLCDCGTEKVVPACDLRSGASQSCGCYNREECSKRAKLPMPEETKRNMSINHADFSGEKHPMYGKHRSEETLQKMSKANSNPSIETRRKISEAKMGEKNPAKRPEVRRKISESKMGDKNPNWNPNITDEERLIKRNYPEYKTWRTSVYEQDNYTCQYCSDNKGGNLIAHHIESYDNNPTLRTELSNGITLCETHHNNFHHIYGKGNNTRKQLNEFLRRQNNVN